MAISYASAHNFAGQTILLRLDLNEPLDDHGAVADDFRLKAILPTIHSLRSQGAKVIVVAHLGRPEGQWDPKLSLRPVAGKLASLLDLKFIETPGPVPDYDIPHLILFTGNITEAASQAVIKSIPAKDIVVLENIRYYPGEDANDPAFATQLASLANVYVNDAFAVCHRAAASTVAITKLLPSYAGPVLEQELKNLSYITKNPKRPLVAVMGGIKISDKAKTLEHLASKTDAILVGGGLANLLLKAQGFNIGQSKIEAEAEETAWHIIQNYKDKLVLPKDVVVARADFSHVRAIPVNQVGDDDAIFDLGPQTILAFSQTLKQAQTIMWNGPLGFFEQKPFHTATMALARVIGGIASGQAFAVVGGGETVDAVRQAGQETYFDHVSTGGGAMLEYLAGTTLPAIAALDK